MIRDLVKNGYIEGGDCEGAPLAAPVTDVDDRPEVPEPIMEARIRAEATVERHVRTLLGIAAALFDDSGDFDDLPRQVRELAKSRRPEIVGPGVRVETDGLRWTARLTPEAERVLREAEFFGAEWIKAVDAIAPRGTSVTLEAATINAAEPAPSIAIGQEWRGRDGMDYETYARITVIDGPDINGQWSVVATHDDAVGCILWLSDVAIRRDYVRLPGPPVADGYRIALMKAARDGLPLPHPGRWNAAEPTGYRSPADAHLTPPEVSDGR